MLSFVSANGDTYAHLPRRYTMQDLDVDFQADEDCLDRIMAYRYGENPKCAKFDRKTKYYRLAIAGLTLASSAERTSIPV